VQEQNKSAHHTKLRFLLMVHLVENESTITNKQMQIMGKGIPGARRSWGRDGTTSA